MGSAKPFLFLIVALTVIPAGASAQIPCQECWTDACKEFKGLIPRCSGGGGAKKPPPQNKPPVEPPPVAAGPCMTVPECNARCSSGEMSACVTMGSMFDNGISVTEDKEKAAFWYKVACDGGSTQGCLRLKQAAAAVQRAQEAAKAEEEAHARQLEAQRLEAARTAIERAARDEEARKRAEVAAREREAARKVRICNSATPFQSSVQTSLPFAMKEQLTDPSYCGLQGEVHWMVPFTLELEENVSISLNRSCNTVSCTLKLPSGEVRKLTDRDLESIRVGAGRSEFLFSGGAAGGALEMKVSRVSACEPGNSALPMLKQDETLMLRDVQASCVLNDKKVHFLELERGSLGEQSDRPGYEYFGYRTVALTFSSSEGAQDVDSSVPAFYRLNRIDSSALQRVGKAETRKRGTDVVVTFPLDQFIPADARATNPYRVFIAVPATGPVGVRRLKYRAPFSMHSAFNLQVAGLIATEGTNASGGISLLIGAGWQISDLLGADFNAVAHFRGNDFGPSLSGSPLMVGVRLGRPRENTNAPAWVRFSGGPVIRGGTASNYSSTQLLGVGFRLDAKPIPGFPLVVSGQLDAFQYEPVLFIFNLGFGL